jgi:aquaporin Z
MNTRALMAECLGTFVLVIGGCGAAVLAGDRIGFLGVALAFGLSLLVAAYAVGHLSGAHVNPAVSVGIAAAGRLPWRELPGYVVAQLVGAIVASGVLWVVATGRPNADPAAAGFATNGWGAFSPGGFGFTAAFVTEVVLTFILVFTILATTNPQAPLALAGVAIGGVLALVHRRDRDRAPGAKADARARVSPPRRRGARGPSSTRPARRP